MKSNKMADLLGSILGSMEKPPSLGSEERKKAKEQKEKFEKMQQKEKEQLNSFKDKIQKAVNDFIRDSKQHKYKFDKMDKVFRAVVHEVADVAGLTSFSFGQEEDDRYVMVWKKEYAPCDEELLAYRRGEEWDPEKEKKNQELQELERIKDAESKERNSVAPQSNYQEKYERILGKESAKDAAKATTANRSYGFVPSENKRDHRTIEEVMAENKARKKQKTDKDEPTPNADKTDSDNSHIEAGRS